MVVDPMRGDGPIQSLIGTILGKIFYDPHRDESIKKVSKKVRKKMKHGKKKK